jgi:hypothetical protein
MKRIGVLYLAVALLAIGAGQAFARSTHAAAPTRVTVVMHDPGCHWFSVSGRSRRSSQSAVRQGCSTWTRRR